MNKRHYIFLLFLSLVGFIASSIIHITTIYGIKLNYNPLYVHAGTILLWIPITNITNRRYTENSFSIGTLFENCPKAMVNLIFSTIFYGFNWLLLFTFKIIEPNKMIVISYMWCFYYLISYSIFYSQTKIKD